MRTILRKLAVVVAIALAPAAALAAPTTEGLCVTAEQATDHAAQAMLDRGMPGIAIAVSRGGRTVFSRGYGIANIEDGVPVTPDTVFQLASVTKQFTAAAILSLVQEGQIGLDDPLSRYVREMPKARRITIRQLLIQTAGVHNFTDDAEGLRTKSVDRSPAEMLDWIAHLRPTLMFKPGSRWAYSNSNYVLLGLVIERVTGQRLQEAFAQRLFGPAGMEHTALDLPADLVPHRARGYRRAPKAPSGQIVADWVSPTMTWAAGGLRTTTGDMLRWSEALFAGKVIDPTSLVLMTQPGRLSDGRTVKHGMTDDWRRNLDSEYGMGLVLTQTPHGARFWHEGGIDGFKSWLAHYPDKNVSIAMLANTESVDLDAAAIEAAVFAAEPANCVRAGPPPAN